MRTLGIDLSANPAKTGACEIDWGRQTVRLLPRPTTDEHLVAAVLAADKTGIDVPLGWPDEFVAAVVAHHAGGAWPPMSVAPPQDRLGLRFRTTDLVAQARGARPLSVSSDLIGVAAMRGARLQHLLIEAGVSVDRSGLTGKVLEAYPAEALRTWGLASRRYKGKANADACVALVAALTARLGALQPAAIACLDGCDDDGLDAFICAVIARAALAGRTTRPNDDQLDVARREGWMHIPTTPLAEII